MNKVFNPWNLGPEWTEEEPWDVVNCLKCNKSIIIPSQLFDMWVDEEAGCFFCLMEEEE